MNTRVDLCILDKLWDDDRIFFRHGAGLSQVHLEVFLWVSNVHCRSTQHIRRTDQTRKTHLLTKLPHCLHIQPMIRWATIAATTDKIHTHTQPFNGPFSGTTICKQSAPRSRQITTPAPHRMPFLPPNQQRQSTEGTIVIDSIVIVIINKSYYCNIKKTCNQQNIYRLWTKHCRVNRQFGSRWRICPNIIKLFHTLTPVLHVHSSGLFCGQPRGLKPVTRLPMRSVTFLWQLSLYLRTFVFLFY